MAFHLRCLLAALALAPLLAGCVQPAGPPAPGVRSDWTTESDESPAGRRARLRLELASAYYAQGQDAVALDEVKRALAHAPGSAAAWNLRGLIYLRLAQWTLSQDSFEQALALAPQDPDVAHNFGWMLCQQAPVRLAQAEPLLRRALAQPGYAQPGKTWTALGLCQQRAGQPAQAEASLRQALALEPGSARAGWPLAQVLYAQGRWREAGDMVALVHAQAPATAESLWLGVRAAHKLDNQRWFSQWAQQLRQEFGRSREAQALDKGWFDE